MTAPAPSPYLKTKVMTASPAELRLMLFDGAIRFAEQGKLGLEQRNYEASYNGLSRAQNILLELINSLDQQVAPELCTKLEALYLFMFNRLVSASSDRKPELVDEVLKLLEYERQTWLMLMERLADEKGSSRTESAPPAAPGAYPFSPGRGRDEHGPTPGISLTG